MTTINEREEALLSMLNAPAFARMGPYFKSGSEKPIQLFLTFERIVHRLDGGGSLFTDILKMWVFKKNLRRPIQLSITSKWIVHCSDGRGGLVKEAFIISK